MAIPTTGPISWSMIKAELQRAGLGGLSLSDPAIRDLVQKPTGPIKLSDFRGKAFFRVDDPNLTGFETPT